MHRTVSVVTALLSVYVAVLPSSGSAQGFKIDGKPNVAIILDTPHNDGGWSQTFDEARLRMEKDLGLKIAYVENVHEEATQFNPPVERFIGRGVNIIIATSFGYSDPIQKMAAKYPKVAFFNASGTSNASNLESFYGRDYESFYLCGMAAGAVSKTGKLGYVSPFPFGVVNWTINAYLLGAQQMNPKATVTAVITGSWDDPAKERAVATALIDQGADVIDQHSSSATPQIVAQERGVYGVGFQRDMRAYAPKATLCSTIWTWDHFLTPTIKSIAAGTWKPSPYGAFVGIKGGGTDIACCNEIVPKDVVDKIMKERQAIMDGKQVFAGPLKDTDGKERVAAGQVLSDGDLWKMDWFVPGVTVQK